MLTTCALSVRLTSPSKTGEEIARPNADKRAKRWWLKPFQAKESPLLQPSYSEVNTPVANRRLDFFDIFVWFRTAALC